MQFTIVKGYYSSKELFIETFRLEVYPGNFPKNRQNPWSDWKKNFQYPTHKTKFYYLRMAVTPLFRGDLDLYEGYLFPTELPSLLFATLVYGGQHSLHKTSDMHMCVVRCLTTSVLVLNHTFESTYVTKFSVHSRILHNCVYKKSDITIYMCFLFTNESHRTNLYTSSRFCRTNITGEIVP
jgi:hypothetical protein